MNQIDHRGRILQAIGAGGMVTALYATFNPAATWASFAWVFVGALGLALFATFPADVFDYYSQKGSEHARRVNALNAPPAPIITTLPSQQRPRHEQAWLEYWRNFFAYAKDKGGLTFERVKEYFGTSRPEAHATWKFILRPFTRDGIITPIEGGKRTEFETGYSFEWVLTALGRGVVLRPEYFPAAPPPRAFESLALPDTTPVMDGNAGGTQETVGMPTPR